MAKDDAAPAPLLALSDEWTKAREVIEKADDRIHETRKIVFGLFSTLLAASSVIGKDRSNELGLWLGVHVALLALLVAGRFVEQQAFLLQAAAASRAWVLELLTPTELTGTICDRFVSIPSASAAMEPALSSGRRDYWPARTTYIYVLLGIVSAAVTGLVAFVSQPLGAIHDYVLWFGLATVGFGLVVFFIGSQDIRFSRNGLDWSLSTTSVRLGETVHILLTNQEDDDREVPRDPVTVVLLEADGADASFEGEAFALPLPRTAQVQGTADRGLLHRRGAIRWAWKPARPGLWGVRVKVLKPRSSRVRSETDGADYSEVYLRRCVYVETAPAGPNAAESSRANVGPLEKDPEPDPPT